MAASKLIFLIYVSFLTPPNVRLERVVLIGMVVCDRNRFAVVSRRFDLTSP